MRRRADPRIRGERREVLNRFLLDSTAIGRRCHFFQDGARTLQEPLASAAGPIRRTRSPNYRGIGRSQMIIQDVPNLSRSMLKRNAKNVSSIGIKI